MIILPGKTRNTVYERDKLFTEIAPTSTIHVLRERSVTFESNQLAIRVSQGLHYQKNQAHLSIY